MQTIIKTAAEMQPGDVFRTQYGDYDNWVRFVFVACRPYGLNSTEIDVHYVGDSAVFKVYDTDPINKIKFEVIGNENTNNCE